MKDQIKQLTENSDRYKFLWETDSEAAKVIMAEMEHQIKVLKKKSIGVRELKRQNEKFIETLRLINASDNSTYNATIAHKVLKEFGKL